MAVRNCDISPSQRLRLVVVIQRSNVRDKYARKLNLRMRIKPLKVHCLHDQPLKVHCLHDQTTQSTLSSWSNHLKYTVFMIKPLKVHCPQDQTT